MFDYWIMVKNFFFCIKAQWNKLKDNEFIVKEYCVNKTIELKKLEEGKLYNLKDIGKYKDYDYYEELYNTFNIFKYNPRIFIPEMLYEFGIYGKNYNLPLIHPYMERYMKTDIRSQKAKKIYREKLKKYLDLKDDRFFVLFKICELETRRKDDEPIQRYYINNYHWIKQEIEEVKPNKPELLFLIEKELELIPKNRLLRLQDIHTLIRDYYEYDYVLFNKEFGSIIRQYRLFGLYDKIK